MNNPVIHDLFAEHGKTLEHSIGVQAIKYDIDQEQGIRKVHEWKLWEFSTLTSWGANENTPLLGIKSIDDLQKVLEKMSNNNRYSDKRKQKVDETLETLFIKPSTMTLKEEAVMNDFISEFLKSNIFQSLKI